MVAPPRVAAYQVARRVAIEMSNGKVALQVVVEDAVVPASAAQLTNWSPAVSEVTRRLTTVPTGMFVAATLTVTAVFALIWTSGLASWPSVGFGTATPFTFVMTRLGCANVEFKGGLTSEPTMKEEGVLLQQITFA